MCHLKELIQVNALLPPLHVAEIGPRKPHLSREGLLHQALARASGFQLLAKCSLGDFTPLQLIRAPHFSHSTNIRQAHDMSSRTLQEFRLQFLDPDAELVQSFDCRREDLAVLPLTSANAGVQQFLFEEIAMSTSTEAGVGPKAKGPKYQLEIEGTSYDWHRDTITVAEIRTLAGFSFNDPVEEIDLNTNTQRTLREDEIVELRPGLGFSKKIKFQRG